MQGPFGLFLVAIGGFVGVQCFEVCRVWDAGSVGFQIVELGILGFGLRVLRCGF